MSGAELMQGLARGTHIAATLSIFGAMLFRIAIAGSAPLPISSGQPSPIYRRLAAVVRLSLLVALISAGCWLALQAVDMADEPETDQVLATLPVVLLQTHFGTLLILRLGLLLFACLTFGRGSRRWPAVIATLFAAIAAGLQVGLGHGMSMGGATGMTLVVAELLHLLAAGAWLGGLLPLLLLIGVSDPGKAVISVHRFSRLGLTCVLVLVGTILVQGWVLIGSPAGLVGTDYGRTALLKGVLFIALLGFAALNRFHFMPGLTAAQGIVTRRHLQWSVVIEAGIGLVVVLAAGVLLTLAPAIHQQPDWPFAHRFSKAVMADPELRDEVLLSLAGVALALVLLALAIVWRRLRWIAIAMAAVIGWLAIPQIDLLLVPAYPTSFYHSPTGFTAAAIARGSELFPANCAACHGAMGRGDGPLAKSLSIPPADLTAGHLFEHGDGDLFWWLSHGIEGPRGDLVMPGFADHLSDDARWNLIDYIRAHNAGLALRETGQWPQPVKAPDITVMSEGKAVPLSTLWTDAPGGQMFRLAAANGDVGPAPPLPPQGDPRIATFSLEPGSDAWTAYAILAGVTSDKLVGTEFLVDAHGWLRAVLRPVDAGTWAETGDFLVAAREAAAHPIAAVDGGQMHHH